MHRWTVAAPELSRSIHPTRSKKNLDPPLHCLNIRARMLIVATAFARCDHAFFFDETGGAKAPTGILLKRENWCDHACFALGWYNQLLPDKSE
jgi:hypothetical protein